MTPPPEAASCARECAQGTAKPAGIGTTAAPGIAPSLRAPLVSPAKGMGPIGL